LGYWKETKEEQVHKGGENNSKRQFKKSYSEASGSPLVAGQPAEKLLQKGERAPVKGKPS